MVSHAGNQSGREIAKGDGPRRCQFSPRCYSRTWWAEGSSGNFEIDNARTRLYGLVSRGTKLDSILALAGGTR